MRWPGHTYAIFAGAEPRGPDIASGILYGSAAGARARRSSQTDNGMKRSNGSRALWAAAAMMMTVIWLPAEAAAQVSIDAGKSPQQVFATDCQPCHKDARTLSKGPAGLAAFLREHYSASRESAKAMADYLVRIGTGGRDDAPAVRRHRPPLRARRGRPAPVIAARGGTTRPGMTNPEMTNPRPNRPIHRPR